MADRPALDISGALPHLTGALRYRSTTGAAGLCFHRAVAFVLDVRGSELCIGTLRGADEGQRAMIPNASPVAFLHAWVEVRGRLFAPTTLEQTDGALVAMEPAAYYEANGVRDVVRMSRPEVLQLSGRFGLSAHFRRHVPTRGGVSVGKVLLEAAGVAYAIADNGGVVPLED